MQQNFFTYFVKTVERSRADKQNICSVHLRKEPYITIIFLFF